MDAGSTGDMNAGVRSFMKKVEPKSVYAGHAFT